MGFVVTNCDSKPMLDMSPCDKDHGNKDIGDLIHFSFILNQVLKKSDPVAHG